MPKVILCFSNSDLDNPDLDLANSDLDLAQSTAAEFDLTYDITGGGLFGNLCPIRHRSGGIA